MRAADLSEHRRSDWRSPGSRARSVRTCQGLRPRRIVQALAMARSDVLPSAFWTASAPGTRTLSWLNSWPMRTPVNASCCTSRYDTHDSGPMWFATPSSSEIFKLVVAWTHKIQAAFCSWLRGCGTTLILSVRSGLRWTTSMRCQLRVWPFQRNGLL